MTAQIIIADDHPIILNAVRVLLAKTAGVRIAGEASSPDELMLLLNSTACDLLVSDLSMSGGRMTDGLHMMQLIRRKCPRLKLIVHTQAGGRPIFNALIKNDVAGIVHKSDALAELADAVTTVLAGGRYRSRAVQEALSRELLQTGAAPAELSEREADVLRLFASGRTARDIAKQLNRSTKTISEHKAKAMAKLGLKTDLELYAYAKEHNLTS